MNKKTAIRRARRFSAVVIGIGFLLASMAESAFAGLGLDRTIAALRNDPVYVDTAARSIVTPAQEQALRTKVKGLDPPIDVAVLPEAAADNTQGGTDAIVRTIGSTLGGRRTVAVVAGTHFRAGSSALPSGTAARLAAIAFDQHKTEGPGGVLLAFVDAVKAQHPQAGANPIQGGQAVAGGKPVVIKVQKKSHTGLVLVLVILSLILLIGGVAVAVALSRRRGLFSTRYAEVESLVDRLGAQVVGLDGSATSYEATASERYTWASSRLHSAKTVGELDAVAAAAQDGLDQLDQAAVVLDSSIPKKKPSKSRKAATKTTERVDEKPPSGRNTVTNYNNTGQQGYWYGGGYHGGVYYGPGYYGSMNFWEGMWLGEMLSDHDNDRSEEHGSDFKDDSSSSTDTGGGDFDSSPPTGGGDFGSSSTGGGDYSAPSYDPPSYDPPSYDPPSSNDFGGGDFGGGGGGFDSGGGGGGDW